MAPGFHLELVTSKHPCVEGSMGNQDTILTEKVGLRPGLGMGMGGEWAPEQVTNGKAGSVFRVPEIPDTKSYSPALQACSTLKDTDVPQSHLP